MIVGLLRVGQRDGALKGILLFCVGWSSTGHARLQSGTFSKPGAEKKKKHWRKKN